MPKTLRWFLLAFLLGLAATISLARLQAEQNADRVEAALKLTAERITRQVVTRMQIYQFGLRGARGALVILGEKGINRAAFRRYSLTRDVDAEFPGALGFGFIRRVPLHEESAFLQSARRDGAPDFAIRQRKPHDEERFVIQYIEPAEPNLAAIGLDIGSETHRRRAATEAIRTGQVALTGPIDLVQASGRKQLSFLILLPIYRDGMPVETEAQRERAAFGWSYAPLLSEAILNSIDFANQGVNLTIVDVTEPAKPVPFFRSSDAPKPIVAGATPDQLRTQQERDVFGRQWRFEFSPRPDLIAQLELTSPIKVMVFGIVASFLLTALASALLSAWNRKKQLAEQLARSESMKVDAERSAELARINAVQAAILDNIPCGLSVFDSELTLVAHNSEFRKLLELESLFVDGAPTFADIIRLNAGRGEYGPGDVESIVAAIVERTRMPVPHQFERVRPNGTPIEVRGAPLPEGGFVTTYTDISMRKDAEAAMRAAMEHAEQANRAKSDFLANMSHEIRTPLNAVLGVAHLISRTPLNYEQKNLLEMIRSSGKSLLSILNDILDFSKIEAGKMELSVSSFSLHDVLKGLATIMSVNAGAKDIALIIDVAPDVPTCLLGDEMRLQQILVNLTGNAIKFTERGEVILSITMAEGQGDEVRLKFAVRDTGIGMTPEQLQRLFSAFSQADSSTTRKFGGTGLGLIISLRLAEMMSGTIDVQSHFGLGTEFALSVPLARGAVDAGTGQPDEPAFLPGLRLLVVDDNASSRAALCRMIAARQWQADCVESTGAAVTQLARLSATQRGYDAILLDWKMPGVDVGEAIAACRATEAGAAIALIVMVSADGRDKLMHRDQPLDADAFLAKPVTAWALQELLAEVLLRNAPHAQSSIARSEAAGAKAFNAHILLVEDNPINQTVALGILQQAGASVEVANHGQEALDLLRQNRDRFDLILMDMQMPVMDGLTATRRIRNELGMTVPILAMTAGVMESERKNCFDCGMNAVIAKPVDIDTMLATIRRFLSGAETHHASVPLSGTEKASESVPRLGHFNIDQMTQAMGAHPAAMARLQGLVAGIVANGMQNIDEAQQAWDAQRSDEAIRIFHTMRGSLGTLGATQVATIAQAMETAMRENDAEQIGVLFVEIEQALGLTIDAARAWLDLRTD